LGVSALVSEESLPRLKRRASFACGAAGIRRSGLTAASHKTMAAVALCRTLISRRQPVIIRQSQIKNELPGDVIDGY
jgi:hypothetical protein